MRSQRLQEIVPQCSTFLPIRHAGTLRLQYVTVKYTELQCKPVWRANNFHANRRHRRSGQGSKGHWWDSGTGSAFISTEWCGNERQKRKLALEIFRWKAMARLHTQSTPNGRKCMKMRDASDARNAKSEKYWSMPRFARASNASCRSTHQAAKTPEQKFDACKRRSETGIPAKMCPNADWTLTRSATMLTNERHEWEALLSWPGLSKINQSEENYCALTSVAKLAFLILTW